MITTPFEDKALKELRAAGFRITMPRVQVIRALAEGDTALSAYQIHEKIISGGGKIDVVSVYRILKTLTECDLIVHMGRVDGYLRKTVGSNLLLHNVIPGTVKEHAHLPYEIAAPLTTWMEAQGVTWWQLEMEVS